MDSKISEPLKARVEMLNKDFFIGEEGTSYGGYYDCCLMKELLER